MNELYTPRAGSRLHQLVMFLRMNPQEYLTYEDIVLKFGYRNTRSVESTMSYLKKRGVVKISLVVSAA